jgi:hypothetical protein
MKWMLAKLYTEFGAVCTTPDSAFLILDWMALGAADFFVESSALCV